MRKLPKYVEFSSEDIYLLKNMLKTDHSSLLILRDSSSQKCHLLY